jgi:7,8-dihydropterin-6-yl-methyl-4-(beta-D-ribofuranosyl)aminobenzene 5'-phosphate synthase
VAASPISPPECALLDELQLLVVVDNETDTLSSIDEGVPQVSEIAHLTARVPTSRMHEGHA